ncbi:MAG TPA: hypothetical protein GXZ22_09090 [Clostridiaceae bacterium]|jgi:hypothetical protein|nr:hypothetical protein [Clostridiaceae bacterium]
MSIGTIKISQISVCTWDLEQAEKSYTTLLGIEPERIQLQPFEKVPAFTHGNPDHNMQYIEFLVYHLADDVKLEVYGPCPKGTPAQEFLEKHGQGVMNFAFIVDDREYAYDQIGKVCEVKGPYHEGFFPKATYSFVDTFKELGVELNIKQLRDNTELISKIVAQHNK